MTEANDSTKDDVVTTTIDQIKPVLTKIGFGTIMGYCSGLVMKKVSQSIGIVLGTAFIGLQVAVSMGYIDVKWDKVSDGVQAKIDVTKDGKIDEQDVKEYWKKVRMILTKNIPSAGGFSCGLLFGVRYG
jgi:uncharacterized membrane protein (Fun14 family)